MGRNVEVCVGRGGVEAIQFLITNAPKAVDWVANHHEHVTRVPSRSIRAEARMRVAVDELDPFCRSAE